MRSPDQGDIELLLPFEIPNRRRHPERSRFSDEAKDLAAESSEHFH
jgi:hypothetical protein